MSDLIPYGEQFEKIVDIIEAAKEPAYRKVNEELILMYRDIGEYISKQSEKAEYGDAFVQKLADFFATNYPNLKGFNRRGLYRMKQFYKLYKDNEKVSPLVTQLDYLIAKFMFWHVDDDNVTWDTYFCNFMSSATFDSRKQGDSVYYELYSINVKLTDKEAV
mgnify:CR=1 FL=1